MCTWQDIIGLFLPLAKEQKQKTNLDSQGHTRSLRWSLSAWLLLAALGITEHFRLAAFGCFGSERVKDSSWNFTKKDVPCFAQFTLAAYPGAEQ